MTDPENPYTVWERNFIEHMFRLRESLQMSQTDLARELKAFGLPFHQQTVQRIEAGERPVRLNEAHLIAFALGTTLDAMTDGKRARGYLINVVGSETRRLVEDLENVGLRSADIHNKFNEIVHNVEMGLMEITPDMSGSIDFADVSFQQAIRQLEGLEFLLRALVRLIERWVEIVVEPALGSERKIIPPAPNRGETERTESGG